MPIPTTTIRPKAVWSLDLPEVWRFRELFLIFAWRDIKVRYKQTLIGASWALFQPLFSMVIFTVFFGRLARIPSGGLPYSLFVLIGLVYWGLFSETLSRASSTLIEHENLIKKVYFPRLILPLSTIITSLVDFCIACALLIVVAVYTGFVPHPLILIIVPLGVVVTALGAGGLGLFLSALNVKYRDVRYVLPFFIQILIFLTPIIYPTSIMRPSFNTLMALNPMTGVVQVTRAVFSPSTEIPWSILGISAVSALGLFIGGVYYFQSTERFFADIV